MALIQQLTPPAKKPVGLFWLAVCFFSFFSVFFCLLHRPSASTLAVRGQRSHCACMATSAARTPCSDAWCTVTAWVSMNLNRVFTGGSTSAGWWDGLILASAIWPWWISCGAVDGSYQNSPRLCVFPSMMHRLSSGLVFLPPHPQTDDVFVDTAGRCVVWRGRGEREGGESVNLKKADRHSFYWNTKSSARCTHMLLSRLILPCLSTWSHYFSLHKGAGTICMLCDVFLEISNGQGFGRCGEFKDGFFYVSMCVFNKLALSLCLSVGCRADAGNKGTANLQSP